MMTPLRFEQLHHQEWSELEIAIGSVGPQTLAKSMSLSPAPGARVALLYRRACEHLALARSRAYPAYIVDRLERVTEDAHQLIYHRPEVGLGRLRHVLAYEFPAAVRAHRRYVAVAAAVFVLPTLIVGALVYARPELILSVVNAETAASFEGMYSPDAESIGRVRTASTDWIMFGYYIRNNIGVSFQCFAGGLFAGLGTLFLCTMLPALNLFSEDRPRTMLVEVVASGRDLPMTHIHQVFAVNGIVFEPREVSQGDEATVRYLATLKPTDSLEDLSAQLMGDGKIGIKNVSWSPPKRA